MNNKSSQSKTSQSSKFNAIKERRNRLREENRKVNLKKFWQIIFFLSFSGLLGLKIIENGWRPIGDESFNVKGSKKISSKIIALESKINFPISILNVQPNIMEKKLLKSLPIQNISINRMLFPPSLEIRLNPIKPIAYAKRITSTGKESGMVDTFGKWISSENTKYLDPPETSIEIEGWLPIHENSIALILKKRMLLNSTLKKIIFSPIGELIIQTETFDLIELGASHLQLEEQLASIGNLTRKLPQHLIEKKEMKIDMRDPLKPELQIKNPKI